jgi:hypothetical protein
MPILGLIIGFFAYVYVGAFIGRQATHNDVAGIFPGIVAALWVAWPLFHLGAIGNRNLMHPKPRIYPGTPQDNFERLHKLLLETVYFYGDRWNIISASTQTNRIVANLTYREEEARVGPNMTQREWVRRFVKVEAYFKDSGDARTIVQFDFEQRAEGLSPHVCDPIIQDIIEAFEASAGVSVSTTGGLDDPMLPAPPWWLLGVTSLSLLCFTWDVVRNTLGMR